MINIKDNKSFYISDQSIAHHKMYTDMLHVTSGLAGIDGSTIYEVTDSGCIFNKENQFLFKPTYQNSPFLTEDDLSQIYSDLATMSGNIDAVYVAFADADAALSGALQASINTKASNSQLTTTSSVLVSYTNIVGSNAVSSGNTALLNASGTLQTNINGKTTTAYVDAQDIAVSGALNTRITLVSGSLQTQLDQKLTLSGGTLTGPLTLAGVPTVSGHASNKFYVDTQAAAAVSSGNASLTSASGVLQTNINTKASTAQLTTTSGDIISYVNSRDTAVSGYANTIGANAVASGSSAITTYSGFAESRFINTAGDTMTGALILSGVPTLSGHASNKFYVDSLAASAVSSGSSSLTTYSGFAEGRFVNTSGDAMTGYLTLHANPTSSGHAATKQYVDNTVINSITNITSTGIITLSGSDGIRLSAGPDDGLYLSANGTEMFQNHGNWNEAVIRQTFALSTSTINTFTLATIPMALNTMMWIECRLTARRTDSTARARYKNFAAGFTRTAAGMDQIGITNNIVNVALNGATLDAYFTISGNNILLQVESTQAQPVKWTAELIYQVGI